MQQEFTEVMALRGTVDEETLKAKPREHANTGFTKPWIIGLAMFKGTYAHFIDEGVMKTHAVWPRAAESRAIRP